MGGSKSSQSLYLNDTDQMRVVFYVVKHNNPILGLKMGLFYLLGRGFFLKLDYIRLQALSVTFYLVRIYMYILLKNP